MNLEEMLLYVSKNVPFFKQFDNSAIDIIKFPIINKSIIRNNYGDFISEELGEDRKKLAEFFSAQTKHAKGWYNEIAMFDDLIIEETSGTSGTSFLCAKRKGERQNLGLAAWSQRLRIDPKITNNNLFLFSHIAMGMKNPNAYDYNANHLRELYGEIQRRKIRWIHGTPVAFKNHMEVMKKNNISIDFSNLKFIECTGFYLDPDVREELEDFFGVTVVNQYGCIETWPIAWSYSDNIFHVNERSIYFELIDENGNVINTNYKPGRVVVTSLQLRTLPFIRYELGDFAEYVEDEGSRLKGKAFRILKGRDCNIIKGLNTRIYGNDFFLSIVKQAKFSHPGIELKYIQFIQKSENVIEVSMNAFAEAGDFLETIKRLLKEKINKKFVVKLILLSEEEVDERKYEKPNLFICRY